MLLAAMALTACANTQKDSDISAGLGPGNYLESVFAIPDSLCTPEQLTLKQTALDIMWTHMDVKDKRLVFNGDRELFTSRGIPPSYYDIVIANIQSSNEALDDMEKEGTEVDMEEVFSRSQRYYFDKRGF